jgi:glucose-6-phosphate-specific signal transduction histidine kinase
VSDDGTGKAKVVAGGGLAGLADRVEALGGKFSVHGDPCADHPGLRGTTLTVDLPTVTT